MKASMRAQAEEGFNRGLAGIAASLSRSPNPADRALIANEFTGMNPDPASQIGNMMNLYNMQYQLQQRAALLGALPALGKEWGLSPQEMQVVASDPQLLSSIFQSHQPAGAYRDWLIARDQAVREAQAAGKDPDAAKTDFEASNPLSMVLGGTGLDPAIKDMRAAQSAWVQSHSDPNDPNSAAKARSSMPSWMTDITQWKAHQTDVQTTTEAAAKDRQTAIEALPGLNDSTDDAIARVDRILAAPNLKNVLGVTGGLTAAIKGGVGMGDADTALAKEIGQLGAQTYAEGLSSDALKGSRKTQAEAKGVASGLSQVNETNQSEDSYRFQLQLLRDKLVRMKANASAAAGIQPTDELAGYEDPSFYNQGGALAGKAAPKTFASRPTQGANAPSPQAQPVSSIPPGVPPGSQYSPSRKQWRDPSGRLYDEQGKPL